LQEPIPHGECAHELSFPCCFWHPTERPHHPCQANTCSAQTRSVSLFLDWCISIVSPVYATHLRNCTFPNWTKPSCPALLLCLSAIASLSPCMSSLVPPQPCLAVLPCATSAMFGCPPLCRLSHVGLSSRVSLQPCRAVLACVTSATFGCHLLPHYYQQPCSSICLPLRRCL
jgi:hypothetical protein